MKNIRIILLVLITSGTMALGGCDGFTDVGRPASELAADAVFDDKDTADAAMAAIYSAMRDEGMLCGDATGMSGQLGLYADELVFYGDASSSSAAFSNNALTASNTDVANWWNTTYSQIYAANAMVEGLEMSTALTETDRDRLMGEALFARAFLHANLVAVFGGVPYITTTDYKANSVVTRMTETEVYGYLKSDLETAMQLLPEAYASVQRIRPNKYVAAALMARICLQNGDYAEAANAASYILNNTELFAWETDLDKIFLRRSTTTIWQFRPRTAGMNTQEGGSFIFTAGPPPYAALSQQLLDAFEPGDLRKEHWTAAVTDGTNTWYYANKYKQQFATASSLEYSIVFRLAEQYLIRAEARAKQGDLIGAKEDLDGIRVTAGLSPTTAQGQQETLDAILRERRVELFTEWGSRFIDLKRAGKLDVVLQPVKPGWNATDRLLPLPEAELLLNPHLGAQNPGY